MIQETLDLIVPNDPASAARVICCLVTGTVSYIAATRRSRRTLAVPPEQQSLADRIRARMAEEPPEIVPMSDGLVERIAGVLAPVPTPVEKPAERPASSS